MSAEADVASSCAAPEPSARTHSVKIEPRSADQDDDLFEWVPKTVSVCDLVGRFVDEETDTIDEKIVGNLFLIGTAHFSYESQADVRTVIQTTQPDVVMVELCPTRAPMLNMDNEEMMLNADEVSTFEIVKCMMSRYGRSQGLMQAAMLIMSSHLTRQLGMAPGGEFRVAYQECLALKNSMFVLADRPVNVTLRRAMAGLSFWHKIKLLFGILWMMRVNITPEEVESLKDGDILEELIRQFGGEFPELTRTVLYERDEYMAFVCNKIAQGAFEQRLATKPPITPLNIVFVVGMGHVKGIVRNLNRQINVESLLAVPSPTAGRASYAFKGLKYSLIIGFAFYWGYRMAKRVR